MHHPATRCPVPLTCQRRYLNYRRQRKNDRSTQSPHHKQYVYSPTRQAICLQPHTTSSMSTVPNDKQYVFSPNTTSSSMSTVPHHKQYVYSPKPTVLHHKQYVYSPTPQAICLQSPTTSSVSVCLQSHTTSRIPTVPHHQSSSLSPTSSSMPTSPHHQPPITFTTPGKRAFMDYKLVNVRIQEIM